MITATMIQLRYSSVRSIRRPTINISPHIRNSPTPMA